MNEFLMEGAVSIPWVNSSWGELSVPGLTLLLYALTWLPGDFPPDFEVERWIWLRLTTDVQRAAIPCVGALKVKPWVWQQRCSARGFLLGCAQGMRDECWSSHPAGFNPTRADLSISDVIYSLMLSPTQEGFAHRDSFCSG